ncbi:MAG: prepilin-type N-terminal cleavage/methylation domain-containing protein [Granulosicoccus sp.]|nr:prepilin-type N-terminal cleavage/methylation domain-containing protein [Granulosicoccus sp.]
MRRRYPSKGWHICECNIHGSRCAGVSLIETVVAIAILAFGLASYSSLLGTMIDSEIMSQRRTTATVLATDKLEEIRSAGFAAVVTGADPLLNASAQADEVDSFYSRTWTVTDNTPMTKTKTVLVTTAWPTKDGAASVQLSTVIAP